MFSLDYLLVCVLSLALMLFAIMKVVNDESDDDRDGGINDWDAPLPDLPEGVVTLDEFEKDKPRAVEEVY
ncbi:MAG: hypothetical protein AAF806_19210 [Bacteroidota bacterium]